MFRKLSVKLTAGIILILMVVTVICVPVYTNAEKYFYTFQELKSMEVFCEKLTQISFTEDTVADEINVLNYDANCKIRIVDENFKLIYINIRYGKNPVIENYSEDATPQRIKTKDSNGILLRKLHTQNGKKYYILIYKEAESVDSIFAYTGRNIFFLLLIYMIVCGISLIILVNYGITPLKQISGITEKIAQKDYSVRYKGRISNDEIGLLATNVNKMADTIEENINSLNNYQFLLKEDLNYMTKYYEVRKDVVSQITHELKTPLAVISSQVEMMNCSKDENKKQFYYNSTMEEIEKMSDMIKKILNYSILEHGIFDGDSKKIDLSDFIEKLCDKRKNHIISSGLIFKTDIEKNCIITINENHIIHVFNNYISNALNYTPDGGKIEVRLRKQGDKIRFSVYNEGMRISDENKDEIWNKFFTSRSNFDENRDVHAGIGLFIVKELSVLEHTECGFNNLRKGVEFWFDFNCDN